MCVVAFFYGSLMGVRDGDGGKWAEDCSKKYRAEVRGGFQPFCCLMKIDLPV